MCMRYGPKTRLSLYLWIANQLQQRWILYGKRSGLRVCIVLKYSNWTQFILETRLKAWIFMCIFFSVPITHFTLDIPMMCWNDWTRIIPARVRNTQDHADHANWFGRVHTIQNQMPWGVNMKSNNWPGRRKWNSLKIHHQIGQLRRTLQGDSPW